MSEREADRSRSGQTAHEAPETEASAEQESAAHLLLAARHRRWIQRKASRASAAAPTGIPETGGNRLSSSVRTRMERQLGADLSEVKVHTGGESAAAAEQLGARAFTMGTDVHFGIGEFAPGTKEGDRLLAHELTHTIQAQKSGIQRKADRSADSGDGEHARGDSDDATHEVSSPNDPAEKEADAAGDQAAEELHGDRSEGGEGRGDSDAAGAQTGGRKISASQKPAIKAQAAPVGRKIYRASRPGDPKSSGPAPMAGKGPPPPAPDRRKSPEETAAEAWCDTHVPVLTAFNPEVAWDFTALNDFETGLKRYVYSPALAQNAKLQAAQKLLKEKKTALEAACVADMAHVSAQLDKLDEHNPASYDQAQNIEASTARWSHQFATPIAGPRGHDAFRMARLRGEALLARILKNRDIALQKALGEIAAVKVDDPEASALLSKPYDAVQAWLNPAAKLPDPSGLAAKLRDAYFDRKMAIVDAQTAKKKKQQEEKENQSQGPAQAAAAGGAPTAAAGGATAGVAGGAAPPTAAAAPQTAKAEPALAKEEKPATPPPLPVPTAQTGTPEASGKKPDVPGAGASAANPPVSAQSAAPGVDKSASAAGATEKKPDANAPQLDGSEGAAFKQLTENKLTFAGETYDQMKQAVLEAIGEQKKKDPEVAALLESIPIEQIMAIRGYTTQDYKAINSSMRGYVPRDEQGKDARELKDPKLRVDPAELLKQLKPYITLATVGLSKLPRHHGTVYRSVHIKEGTDRFKQHTTRGAVIQDAAFTSTSANPNISMGSDDNFKFVIEHKNGRRVDFLSQFENEKEVLFAPGTSFQVLGVEKELDGDVMKYTVMLKEMA